MDTNTYLLSVWHLEGTELVNLAFQILDFRSVIEHFLVQLRPILLVVTVCSEYFQLFYTIGISLEKTYILIQTHGLALHLCETGFDTL